jgi:hypothetical protein
MRKPDLFRRLLGLALAAAGPVVLAQSDISTPGDELRAIPPNRSPADEGVANAVDNSQRKYLNFAGANGGETGFVIAPAAGLSVVNGLTIQSANDAPERDPATYRLEGSNEGAGTTNFFLIAEGSVPAFTNRFHTVEIGFSNTTPYRTYRLLFPTTASANGCCMQVAEIEFLGSVLPQDITQPGDTLAAIPPNRSPADEGVANAIDNSQRKYLNFAGANGGDTGFTVTPSVGATVITGIGIQSANDAPERDPANYLIEGSNDGTNFVQIVTNTVAPFSSRFQYQYATFPNSAAYRTYRVTFPDTATSNGCCMQVSEIELLGQVAPQDVTAAGDPVVAIPPNRSPADEGVANVIDNSQRKYLNFAGANGGDTGFDVSPSVGRTLVIGLTIQSANDAPERDPATYALYGSNDGTAYTLISSNTVPAFTTRFQTVQIDFENSVPYRSYRLLFPDTASANGCCMQVAEVELLGFPADSSAAPQFRQQPQNTPVLLGANATFAADAGPFRYQWQRSGTNIPGATQRTYTTPAATAADNGTVYNVVVSNGALSSRSDDALLSIFTPSTNKSIGLSVVGGGANGAPTSLEPTDIAGVHLQAYWNNLTNSPPDYIIKDSDNADSTVTVSFVSSGQWGSGTASGSPADSGDRKLFNGYLEATGEGRSAQVTFSGVPAGNHAVIVYFMNRPRAAHDADYFIADSADPTVPTSPVFYTSIQNSDQYNAAPGFVRATATNAAGRATANFARFNNVRADSSGSIMVVSRGYVETGEDPAGTGPIAGVQLLVSPPEEINPPTLASQPISTNVTAGTTVTFSVSASGSGPITYVWSRNGIALTDGGRVSGSRSSALVISGATTDDEGVYSARVSNPGGNVTSSSAVLAIFNGSITDRLVAHWKFDETTGQSASNSVAGGEAGTLQGFIDNSGWQAGRIGGALAFAGFDQFVTVPDYTKPTRAMSVSAWVNASAAGDNAMIIGNPGIDPGRGNPLNQFILGLQGTDGDVRGGISVGSAVRVREGATSALPLSEWQHIAMVADGAQLSVYRNGALVAFGAYSGNLVVADAPCLQIGGLLNGTNCLPGAEGVTAGSFWTGLIDDVGLWTRGISSGEVVAIYNAGRAGRDLSTLPPIVVTRPTLSVSSGAGGITISWPSSVTGFILQSRSELNGGVWTAVSGVANNSVTIANPTATTFYRLLQQ